MSQANRGDGIHEPLRAKKESFYYAVCSNCNWEYPSAIPVEARSAHEEYHSLEALRKRVEARNIIY